ncbi:MAG: hypothetical protein OEM21_03775 [Nitrosopumilus sp.]|nr:hypothetical protein [Nitrosopumilus sp.]
MIIFKACAISKIMKTMTCKQLGGSCDKEFQAKTFEKIAEMSKKHGMEMCGKGDEDHINAMKKMKDLMNNHEGMKEWMKSKQKEFESVPEK